MLGLAAAFFLMGFSPTVFQLLIFRFFQGVFSGFTAPSLALQASCTPEDRMGQALGTLQTAQVTRVHRRAPAGWIAFPFDGLSAHLLLDRRLLPDRRDSSSSGSSGRSQGRRRKERRSRLRQNLLDVYHSANLRTMLVLLIMIQVSIQIVTPFLSLYVEYLKVAPDRVGLMTGLVFGITGVTNALTTPFWGKRADQGGVPKNPAIFPFGHDLILSAPGICHQCPSVVNPPGRPGNICGRGDTHHQSIVQRSSAAENRGAIYGIFQSGLLMGNVAGPLIGGALAAAFGLRLIFLITTGLFFLSTLWERKTRPSKGNRASGLRGNLSSHPLPRRPKKKKA